MSRSSSCKYVQKKLNAHLCVGMNYRATLSSFLHILTKLSLEQCFFKIILKRSVCLYVMYCAVACIIIIVPFK